MKYVPRFEPEVLEAAARSSGRDLAEVGTSSLCCVTFLGVELISRYYKAHELERMQRMVKSVPPYLRRHLESIFCDGKARADYIVVLTGCDAMVGRVIGTWLEVVAGPHNGFWLEGPDFRLTIEAGGV